MQNRPMDVKYCGVDEEKIKTAEPVIDAQSLEWFTHWIKERYSVHIKKDVLNAPQPWTKDKILANYRFTNVRREQDRQSQYLIKNIVQNDKLTLEEKVINCILFRCWNLWSTMRDLGGPWTKEQLLDGATIKQATKIYNKIIKEHPKHGFFTSVFLVSGMKAAGRKAFKNENAVINILRLGKQLVQKDYAKRCLEAKDPLEFVRILQELPGIAGFLSYQMFVDCTYIPEFQFSENEFTVAGPGCRRGIRALFTDPKDLTPEECIFWLRDNLKNIAPDFDPMEFMTDLPEEERFLSVVSLENCFCEFSKYYKSCINKGRPKLHYVPYKGDKDE